MSDETGKYVDMSIKDILTKHGVYSSQLELDLLRNLIDKIIQSNKAYREAVGEKE